MAALNIIVTAKQVIDHEIPASALSIDETSTRVTAPSSFKPIVNGFDDYALEAALRLKEAGGANITVLSVGSQFDVNIMRKTLAMGADRLILCQDPAFTNLADSFTTAQIIAAAIRKIGEFDLILCGRQASDWDNAQVPLVLAELLALPCITLAQKIEVTDGKVTVEQVVTDGYRVAEAGLPALITVTNELGEPRYPALRNIMAANRKRPTTWKVDDLDLDPAMLTPQLEVIEVAFPSKAQACEMIESEDGAEAGRRLAQVLHEAGLI
jgi:electron transfer flavoprotein beta subunit